MDILIYILIGTGLAGLFFGFTDIDIMDKKDTGLVLAFVFLWPVILALGFLFLIGMLFAYIGSKLRDIVERIYDV